MAALLSWFRKSKDDDYSTVLAALATDIDERRQKLSEIRRREQRTTAVVTIYTLVGWAVYMTLWYVNALPRAITGGIRVVETLGVIVGPILIVLLRRVIGVWYKRKQNAEEKTLQKLMKEQRTKVEEIKKKTNWYETRELMQRYDEPSTPKGPNQKPAMPGGVGTPTPSRPGPGSMASLSFEMSLGNVGSKESSPLSTPNGAPEPVIPPPRPPTPARRTWLDKLADAMVGDSDDTARYALICEECFEHNGLVKEQEWDTIQYKCPKCGHLNKSRRPSIQASQPPLPATPSHVRTPPGPSALPVPSMQPSRPAGSPLRHRVPSAPEEKMELDE